MLYQFAEGVCIYDVAQVNSRPKDLLSTKQVGLLHDTTFKRAYLPVNLQLVCGNLSGQVVYYGIQIAEREKRPLTVRNVIEQHGDYVNSIKTSQMTDRCLVVSGDSSGTVKFIELREQNGGVAARLQSEIQTLSGLKDMALLKTRSKELRLVVENGFGVIQIFDSQGTMQTSVNEQLDAFNEQNLSQKEDAKVTLPTQRL